MKKYLFTLAALCAFGFASAGEMPQSQPCPDLAFTLNNEAVTEVTMAPGESLEVTLTIMEMYMPMYSGCQLQWRMYDVDHNNINYTETNKVAPGKVYGSRVKTWYEGVEYGTSTVTPGVGTATATPYDNVYRIMITNSVDNMSFFREDLDGNPTGPQNFGHFTLVASENWNEEFATFELDTDYSLWNQCPDFDPNDFEQAKYTWNGSNYSMILKVKNANFQQQDEVADPVITFSGEETTTMTVTVTCETEGATLVVNGEEINANTYTYTVDRADVYTSGTVTCVATASKGTATSNEVEASKDWVVADPQTVAAPEINYTMDDDNVYVTVSWPTSTGNQVYTGQYTYPRPAYGEADQSYDVEAYVEADLPYYAESTHATATIPVPAKAPVWQNVADPVITYQTTATQVIVTVTWPETTGDKVYTGEYVYDRPAYGQPDESYDVTAYTTENYPYRASGVAEATIPVPAQDPVWQDVAAPVINYTMDATTVTVTITWPETTGDHVYTGEYTYNRPEYGQPDESYDVTAYTTENYPYRASAVAEKTIPVPAKAQVLPDVVGAPTFQGYTIDGVFGYGTYILPSTEGSSIKYRVLVWNDVTNDWDELVDWTDYTGAEGEIYYTNNGGKYRVEAYAYIGEVESTVVSYEFVVQEITGINEMMGGKTVANVRYFNMAGQEMTEANGVTIVVTTYTDGTTNAVKVMK